MENEFCWTKFLQNSKMTNGPKKILDTWSPTLQDVFWWFLSYASVKGFYNLLKCFFFKEGSWNNLKKWFWWVLCWPEKTNSFPQQNKKQSKCKTEKNSQRTTYWCDAVRQSYIIVLLLFKIYFSIETKVSNFFHSHKFRYFLTLSKSKSILIK